jgi:glycosyltransferase involved in cell wall biosynthesis
MARSRLDPTTPDPIAAHLVMLEEAFSRAHEFDVIHAHVDYLSFPFARRVRCPVVTTLHGRLDLPSLGPVFREYPEQRVVSISDHQRRPLPDARWQATIHHGLPPELYEFRDGPGGYLAFLGRISPEKRPDRAIAIAKASGRRLRIAAKVDAADRTYFEEKIEPLLEGNLLRPPAVHEIASVIAEDPKRVEAFLARAAKFAWTVRVAPNRYFRPAAIRELAQIAVDEAAKNGGQFTASVFRDRTGVGRTVAIEVLEYFDRAKFTRRTGDVRQIMGPPPLG